MPDRLSDVRKALEDRLGELEAEADRLRGALESLRDDRPSARRRRRAPRRRATRAGTSRRASRGQRQAEFLAALQRSPGAKVPAIAEQMGVAPNQVYGLARRLHRSGQIRKRLVAQLERLGHSVTLTDGELVAA